MTHDTHQAGSPLTLNGHQLLDALNAIAPDRTDKQLRERVCVGRAPLCMPSADADVPDLFCWLADYPDSGSILLHRAQLGGEKDPCDVLDIAHKLIEAARRVCKTENQRELGDARRLALAVIKLVKPIIDEHHEKRKSRAD